MFVGLPAHLFSGHGGGRTGAGGATDTDPVSRADRSAARGGPPRLSLSRSGSVARVRCLRCRFGQVQEVAAVTLDLSFRDCVEITVPSSSSSPFLWAWLRRTRCPARPEGPLWLLPASGPASTPRR